jgi:hypothetical protein
MGTFDMPGYTRLWRDRRGRFAGAMAGAREELAREAQALARAALERLIYSKPEDVSGTGRKRWTRTRNLINNETAEVRGQAEVVLTNAMDYAEPRHEAGKPGRRNINPNRVAHWRDAIRPELRELQLKLAARKLLELLGGG